MFFKILLVLTFFLGLTACSSAEITSNNSSASYSNVELGIAYLQSGKMELAKAKLILALEEDPKNSMALGAMGYFLERAKDNKNAEKYYLQAIKVAKSKELGASFNNYGTYLYREHRYKEAIQYFFKAINEPNYLRVADAYTNAGIAALGVENYKLARVFLTKALDCDPGLPVARKKLAEINNTLKI